MHDGGTVQFIRLCRCKRNAPKIWTSPVTEVSILKGGVAQFKDNLTNPHTLPLTYLSTAQRPRLKNRNITSSSFCRSPEYVGRNISYFHGISMGIIKQAKIASLRILTCLSCVITVPTHFMLMSCAVKRTQRKVPTHNQKCQPTAQATDLCMKEPRNP